MASWFYASEGKQQGPYPEGQFRDLVAQGLCARIRWCGPRAWPAGRRPPKFPA